MGCTLRASAGCADHTAADGLGALCVTLWDMHMQVPATLRFTLSLPCWPASVALLCGLTSLQPVVVCAQSPGRIARQRPWGTPCHGHRHSRGSRRKTSLEVCPRTDTPLCTLTRTCTCTVSHMHAWSTYVRKQVRAIDKVLTLRDSGEDAETVDEQERGRGGVASSGPPLSDKLAQALQAGWRAVVGAAPSDSEGRSILLREMVHNGVEGVQVRCACMCTCVCARACVCACKFLRMYVCSVCWQGGLACYCQMCVCACACVLRMYCAYMYGAGVGWCASARTGHRPC